MSKRGHTEEQILRVLHQAEGGTRKSDLCREHGISEATYYVEKKKYARLGLSELRELRQLREENSKLKRLVADLYFSTAGRPSFAGRIKGQQEQPPLEGQNHDRFYL
jgi:putative transposase